MRCTKCAAEIDDDSEFCSFCGEAIKLPSASNPPIIQSTQNKCMPEPAISSKNRKIVLATALIITIVVVFLFLSSPAGNSIKSMLPTPFTPPAPPFDFELRLSSSSGTVMQGNNIQTSVTISLTSGSSQQVSLSASGPTGVTFNFNPQMGTPYCTSTLTIGIPQLLASKEYSITITASGGGKTHTNTYKIYVLCAKIFVSGTVKTVGFGTNPTGIKFVSINTGKIFEAKVDGGSYRLLLPNQQSYEVTCSWTGLLWSSGTFDGGTLSINEGVGVTTMNRNFEG